MSHSPSGKPIRLLTGGALRVFRLEAASNVYIRTLSPTYGGLFTHWHGRRSLYCMGDDCPSALHKTGTIYKGYAAVEVYNEQSKLWYPYVLELSENAELDVQGRWDRGQVWHLKRDKGPKGKHAPVTARFCEHCDLAKLPEPFDVISVLQHLYHHMDIRLTVKNPLPPRVIVEASSADMPKELQAKVERPLTADEEAQKRKMVKDFLAGIRGGSESPSEPR